MHARKHCERPCLQMSSDAVSARIQESKETFSSVWMLHPEEKVRRIDLNDVEVFMALQAFASLLVAPILCHRQLAESESPAFINSHRPLCLQNSDRKTGNASIALVRNLLKRTISLRCRCCLG